MEVSWLPVERARGCRGRGGRTRDDLSLLQVFYGRHDLKQVDRAPIIGYCAIKRHTEGVAMAISLRAHEI